VQNADDVGAVVHGDVGTVVDAGVDVAVVRRIVLAFDGMDADTVLVDEGGGHVVLGAQRVAGAQDDVGAARLERAHEVGRLGRDVQAGADAHAFERLLDGEALADGLEHGHVHVGPLDAQDALRGEADVLDVVLGSHGRSPHSRSSAAATTRQAATLRP